MIGSSSVPSIRHDPPPQELPFPARSSCPASTSTKASGIDDPEKAKWRDFVFRARGRDLKGAIFDLASLPKVDFKGAELQGASLDRRSFRARRSMARSFRARRSLARSFRARRSMARSFRARRSMARSFRARRSITRSFRARRSLARSFRARRSSARSFRARRSICAQLQGASLDDAQLQGASLYGAQLLAQRGGRDAEVAAVRLPDWPDLWRPSWSDLRPFNPANDKTSRRTCDAAAMERRGLPEPRKTGSSPAGRLRDKALIASAARLRQSRPERSPPAIRPSRRRLKPPHGESRWKTRASTTLPMPRCSQRR